MKYFITLYYSIYYFFPFAFIYFFYFVHHTDTNKDPIYAATPPPY